MDNKRLFWTRKYNNNQFIIASRAYFQQSGQKILLPKFTTSPKRRTLPFIRLCSMASGSPRWMLPRASPLSASSSLLRFGKDSPTSSQTQTCQIPSLGNSLPMATILQPRHTGLSFLAWWTRIWIKMCGRTGRPQKCKFFAWLVISNRIWTADSLHRRGWPNCNLCPLCQQVPESAAHLLFQCRYTIRVWGMIKGWLALHDVRPDEWIVLDSVKDWWTRNATKQTPGRLSRWWCSSLGKYGRNEMLEFSATLQSRWECWSLRSKRSVRFGALQEQNIWVTLCRESNVLYSGLWPSSVNLLS